MGELAAWTQDTSGSFGLKQLFLAASSGEKSLKTNAILSEMFYSFYITYMHTYNQYRTKLVINNNTFRPTLSNIIMAMQDMTRREIYYN